MTTAPCKCNCQIFTRPIFLQRVHKNSETNLAKFSKILRLRAHKIPSERRPPRSLSAPNLPASGFTALWQRLRGGEDSGFRTHRRRLFIFCRRVRCTVSGVRPPREGSRWCPVFRWFSAFKKREVSAGFLAFQKCGCLFAFDVSVEKIGWKICLVKMFFFRRSLTINIFHSVHF